MRHLMEGLSSPQLAHLGKPLDHTGVPMVTHESIPPKSNYMQAVAGSQIDLGRKRESVKVEITNHPGMPAIIFEAEDYYGIWPVQIHYQWKISKNTTLMELL